MTAPAQQSLLALQDLDSAIDRQRHRRVSLPERAQLADVDRRLAGDGEARRHLQQAVSEVARRQAALEAELDAAEGQAANLERRLAGGEAGTGRDMAAMTASLDHLRQRISDLEDRVLAVLDERAPLDHQVATADDQLAQLQGQRGTLAGVIARHEEAIDGELALLEADRPALEEAVPEDLRAEYQRLRRRLDGVAVARLVGSRCDGCHLTLSATELDRIRRLPEDALVHCEQCGRILVRS
ncbi:MAG TPA: C4-type zinc ribbon domain-containing protein [Acidimicrobiales bacterium]|nr:C4-type zinc ribbon domain-containing protein [Acidimicrobiales bacterium]